MQRQVLAAAPSQSTHLRFPSYLQASQLCRPTVLIADTAGGSGILHDSDPSLLRSLDFVALLRRPLAVLLALVYVCLILVFAPASVGFMDPVGGMHMLVDIVFCSPDQLQIFHGARFEVLIAFQCPVIKRSSRTIRHRTELHKSGIFCIFH